MPKRGLGTQAAVFAVVVVFVVVALGLVSLAQPGSTSGSTTSSNMVTQATFLYRTMPTEFAVGGYKFYMGYNGTGFATDANGSLSINLGFNLEFTVSNGLTNQTTVFGWAPPAPLPGALPTPDKASLFGGGVELDWFTNSAGTYLQVSASAASGYAGLSNTAVSTVTVTTTLTTQASQATTTYAIPTSDCTYMPVITITTTTITVEPTPPASTTTTTVTTTSTIYSQTVTETSCTFSTLPWVTSTVTTTANP